MILLRSLWSRRSMMSSQNWGGGKAAISESRIRWGARHGDKIEKSAKELADLRPDVILASTTPTLKAPLQQTHTIPIVFYQVSDPLGDGFVASLARPGGNVTGICQSRIFD